MTKRVMDEGQLVQLVYDVAESRSEGSLDDWQRVLVAFSEYLSADKANIFLVDPRGQMVETRVLGVENRTQQDYHQHYQAIDPRFAHAMRRPDQVFSDVLAFDRRTFERTEIHNDYLMPNGVRRSLFVNVQFAPGQLAPQAYFRAPGRAPFLQKDVERLQRLVPHLARALRFRQLLGLADRRAHDLQKLLDGSALPLALIDVRGHVLCISDRAQQLIATTPSLELQKQRLTAANPRLNSALQGALQASLRMADAGCAAATPFAPPLVEVEREGSDPLTLLYLPLRPQSEVRKQSDSRGRVLIAFHDPAQVTRLDSRMIAQLFRLTPREAELASALAEGRSVLQFALDHGCSEQTARVHLKRVLEKTQTRRQPDLVRLLLTSTALRVTALD